MHTIYPSLDYLLGRLSGMRDGQIRQIALRAGISRETILSITRRRTLNPGLETVRSIDMHIDAVKDLPKARMGRPPKSKAVTQ